MPFHLCSTTSCHDNQFDPASLTYAFLLDPTTMSTKKANDITSSYWEDNAINTTTKKDMMFALTTVSTLRACCFAALCAAVVLFVSQNGDLHRHGFAYNVGIPVGENHKTGVFEFFHMGSHSVTSSLTEP